MPSVDNNTCWIAEVLLKPSLEHNLKLQELGVPEWAIRLDLLGVMLPDMSWTYRNCDGLWHCFSMNTTAIKSAATTEADARAIKLISLLELNEVKLEDILKRLEGLAA